MNKMLYSQIFHSKQFMNWRRTHIRTMVRVGIITLKSNLSQIWIPHEYLHTYSYRNHYFGSTYVGKPTNSQLVTYSNCLLTLDIVVAVMLSWGLLEAVTSGNPSEPGLWDLQWAYSARTNIRLVISHLLNDFWLTLQHSQNVKVSIFIITLTSLTIFSIDDSSSLHKDNDGITDTQTTNKAIHIHHPPLCLPRHPHGHPCLPPHPSQRHAIPPLHRLILFLAISSYLHYRYHMFLNSPNATWEMLHRETSARGLEFFWKCKAFTSKVDKCAWRECLPTRLGQYHVNTPGWMSRQGIWCHSIHCQ